MAELCLDILGASFTITTDEDELYLCEVMEKYRKAVVSTANISGINDPLNVAILTGFILCDELNKAEQQLKNESIEINKCTMKLISKLDMALKACGDEKSI